MNETSLALLNPVIIETERPVINENMIILKYDINNLPPSLLKRMFDIPGFQLMYSVKNPSKVIKVFNPDSTIEHAIERFKENFGESIYIYVYNPLSILERLSRIGFSGDFTSLNLSEIPDPNLERDVLILNMTLKQRTDYFTNVKRWKLPLDVYHSNLDWSPYDYNGNTLFYSVVTETGIVIASSRTVLPNNQNEHYDEFLRLTLANTSSEDNNYFEVAIRYLENIELLGFQELDALKRSVDFRYEVIDLAKTVLMNKFCSIERLCSSPDLAKLSSDKLELMMFSRLSTLFAEMSMANIMELMGRTQWLFQTDPTFSKVIDIYYKGSTNTIWQTEQARYSPDKQRLVKDTCISIMLDLEQAWKLINEDWREYFKSYSSIGPTSQIPLNFILNGVPISV